MHPRDFDLDEYHRDPALTLRADARLPALALARR